VRFQYESFVTPRLPIFDYEVSHARTEPSEGATRLGGYDPSQYASERFACHSPDGTHVPLSVVHRRDTPRDGLPAAFSMVTPAMGISVPVNFSSNRLTCWTAA